LIVGKKDAKKSGKKESQQRIYLGARSPSTQGRDYEREGIVTKTKRPRYRGRLQEISGKKKRRKDEKDFTPEAWDRGKVPGPYDN